jgi:shikimate 5-dehydrogenase
VLYEINVEQDHNFDGNGRRAFYGSGGSRRAIMHPLQRAKSKSLSVKMLR